MKSINLPLRTTRASQRGMTLIEAIVAIFVFTVVFLAALALYQSANRAYLRTDAATIQQQNVRFAMDRMMETLRDAGANYNPLGSTKLADEQIEGSWESAVFVRGDFDNAREDGTGGSQDLEDTTWPMVTTGNDEIVGFVLRKDGAGSQTLQVKMDTSAPRNALVDASGAISDEETKTVRVAVKNLAEQTNPPYQLVKVTFDTAGEPVYEVLAENVFRLWFDYLPATGTTEVTPIAGQIADDAGRAARKTIRRIGVTLIGMTDRADFGYTDPATYTPVETSVTKSHRKLSLSQTLLAVNLGRKGRRHYLVPAMNIVSPEWIKACNGHCRRYRISWPESDTGGVQYEVNFSAPADAAAGLTAFEDSQTTSNLFWEFEEPAGDELAGVFRTWTFRVRAITGVEEGDWTTSVTRVGNVNSQSIPGTAQDVSANQFSGSHAMALRWTAVAENEAPIIDSTCIDSLGNTSAPDGPWNVAFKDVADYKIYRVLSTGLNNGDDATTDISNTDLGELKNDSTTAANFVDYTAAPCSSYFYRVKACDICGTTSTNFSPAMAQEARIAPPDAGVNPAKPGTPTLTGPLAYNSGNYTFSLTWPHLTRTSDSQLAATSHYVVEQWRRVDTVDSTFVHQPAEDMDIVENNVSDPITVPDTVSGNPTSYEFRVRGVYDCTSAEGGPRQGELSDPFTLGCTPSPSHTVELASPVSGVTYVRPTDTAIPFQINVGGADADWSGAKIEIKLGTAIVRTINLNGAPAGGRYAVNHDMLGLADGVYTAVAFATTTQSCSRYSTPISFELDTLDCGLTFDDTTDDLIPATNATGLETQFQFKVTNSCATDVILDGMKLVWSGGRNASAFITKIQYNGVDVTAALNATTGASDALIPFTTNVTVPASGTSSFFKVFYSARKDGTTWSSIQARHDDDQSMDETLSSPIKQACAVDYDYSTDQLQPDTGSTRERQFRFRVNNPCGEDIIVDAVNLTWGNTNTITKIQYNGTDVTSTALTAGSGSTITFTSPITLPTGTSAYFRVFYSDRMNTTWSSIIFRHRSTQEFTEALGSGGATPTSGPVTSP